MTTEQLLMFTLRVLAAVCVTSVLIMGVQGLRLVLGDRSLRRRLDAGQSALNSLVTGDPVEPEAFAPLRGLPPDEQDELLIGLGRSLDGPSVGRLADLAAELGATARARRLVESRVWWRRLRGAQVLTAIGGEEDSMLPLLHDPHTTVREQAVHWAASHPSPSVARAFLQLLLDPEDVSDFVIIHALIELGDIVTAPLVEQLETWSGPPLERALRVAAARPHPDYTPAALRLIEHADAGVRACAAEILAAVAPARAVDRLEPLLTDVDARARSAAASAMGRMGHEPAAPQLAGMLRDPAWEVRSTAGLALLELGETGQDLLRAAILDPDPFAAGMAREVLDIDYTQGATDR